jgi:hypothetical protein
MLGNTYNFYVRKVASFVGHANNMYAVIGNIAYLITKHLTIDINKSFSWYILYIKLPEFSVQQLIFCKEFI